MYIAEEEAKIIYLNGKITSSIYDQLNQIISTFGGKIVVFSFQNLDFINSIGIGSILKLIEQYKERKNFYLYIGNNKKMQQFVQYIQLNNVIPVIKQCQFI